MRLPTTPCKFDVSSYIALASLFVKAGTDSYFNAFEQIAVNLELALKCFMILSLQCKLVGQPRRCVQAWPLIKVAPKFIDSR